MDFKIRRKYRRKNHIILKGIYHNMPILKLWIRQEGSQKLQKFHR